MTELSPSKRRIDSRPWPDYHASASWAVAPIPREVSALPRTDSNLDIDEGAPAGAPYSTRPGPLLGIRARVPALILVCQAVLIWWAIDGEVARGIHLVCYSLMMPTVLYLLLIRVARRWLPFEDGELLLSYVVLTATIPIIGYGAMRFVAEGAGYLAFYSNTQTQWLKYLPFLDRLPLLRDPEAIHALYRGGQGVPWAAWSGVIAFWSTYFLLLSAIWICTAGVLRRIWVHQERLTFPIAMLPLRMYDPNDDIFRKPIFWIGFAIPAVMQSLLALHYWYPSIPAMQLKQWDIKPVVFTSPPWDAMPSFTIGFYPMAVGLAYFVPSDVSFSCWFLALAMRFTYVAAAIFGVEAAGTGASRFPYREEQASGAWMAFAGLALWGARHHWRTVAELVPRRERRQVASMAALAVVCAVLCAKMMALAGISPYMSLGVIVVYMAYVITGARVRAEAGAQWTFAPLVWTPHRVTTSLMGTRGMGTQAFLATGTFDLVHVDIRAQSLPYLMEGLAIAEQSGIRWRTVLLWVGIGTVTALALGWFSTLTRLYELGAATAKAEQYPIRKVQIAYNGMDRLTLLSGKCDLQGAAAMAFGGALTILLSCSRHLGPLGLHPVGYVLCNTLTMNAFIVPFLIAWLVKTVVLRFGGNRTYRQSVPMFVGIILGDIVTQAFWALFGSVFDVPIYQFLT